MNRAICSILDFHNWLDLSGRGFLHAGLDDLSPGDALLEIFRRAGVRGIKSSDLVSETLPMARDIIALRCKPRIA